jgi:hypothetical protein
MATKRAAKPAKKPVKAARAPAKTSKAKKAPAKKGVAKKLVTERSRAPKKAKPISKKAFKEQSVRTRASVNARKSTIDATTVRPEPDPSAPPKTATTPKTAPRPPRRSAVERLEDAAPAAGAVLIERVVGAIERELVQIDSIVGKGHVLKAQRTEAERRARTLASLARTLTEVRKLRAEEDKLKPKHDDGPEDIEEFRRALSEKLDRLVRESKEIYPEESDGAGDA